MPRRRQRFARLERELRRAGGEVKADSVLGRYAAFKRGETKIEVNQTLTSAQRKRYGWGVIPFNKSLLSTDATPDDYYVAPITAYSNDGRKAASLSLSDAQLGYESITPETRLDDGFYPALLRVFVRDSANSTATEKRSSITNEPYKRHPGKSYSLPFGRTITGLSGYTLVTVSEEVVKNELARAAKESNFVGGVSYEPEVFRPGRPILESPD